MHALEFEQRWLYKAIAIGNGVKQLILKEKGKTVESLGNKKIVLKILNRI